MAKQPDVTSPLPPLQQSDIPSFDSLSAIERTVMLVRILEWQRNFAAGLSKRSWDESFVHAELRWFHEQWDKKNNG